MLDKIGIKLPNHKVRDILQDLKNKGETDGDSLSKSGLEKVRKVPSPTLSVSHYQTDINIPP